jgi:hypothetical protein
MPAFLINERRSMVVSLFFEKHKKSAPALPCIGSAGALVPGGVNAVHAMATPGQGDGYSFTPVM